VKKELLSNVITLTAVGDIMLGDGPACAGHGVGSSMKRKGSITLLKNIEPFVKRGDIAFGNLECVVSNYNIVPNKMKLFPMRAHPDTLEGLVSAGFNMLSLANNHIMEYGKEGLQETIDHLSGHGIKYIGISSSIENSRRLNTLTIKGVKFIFLAYCLVPDKTVYNINTNPEEIYRDIKDAKTFTDIVIVSVHWGKEFIEIPSPDQIQIAHQMINSGANLILGHHSHILQGIEQYHQGLIAYSLGNFVFDVNYLEELRSSVILECRFSRNGIVDYDLHPVYIDKHYRPVVLEGEEKNRALLTIKQLSSNLKNAARDDIQEYEKKVNKRRRSIRKRMMRYFMRNIYRYPWQYTWHTIIKYMKKKLL